MGAYCEQDREIGLVRWRKRFLSSETNHGAGKAVFLNPRGAEFIEASPPAEKGETRIEVRGVSGPTCLDVTAELEAKLGKLVGERTRTSAYFDAVQPKTQSVIRTASKK